MFEGRYQPKPSDAELWGEHYAYPSAHDHRTWVLVARYDRETDGQPVEVYQSGSAGGVYRVVALPTHDAADRPSSGFVLETGTGMHELAKRMAEAVARGMLIAVPGVEN